MTLQRSILRDVAEAYFHAMRRYEQSAGRGDFDRADNALAEMQEIERCVSVNEISTSWRRTVAERLQMERAR